MSYAAHVLADSVTARGDRLVTVQVTFPRWILAEVNTHRVFSRNSASSRAIPTERIIEQVEADPFVPETFHARVKGMGVGDPVREEKQEAARKAWLYACEDALDAARRLNEIGIDKSRVNRLLEPFMWHTAIISSTEWDNFFALRTPPGEKAREDFPAQLEFQETALLMRSVMRESEPTLVQDNDWHLPLVAREEMETDPDLQPEDPFFWPKVSAGRCARVSYLRHEDEESPRESYLRAARLERSGHLSPFEHVAQPDLGIGEPDLGNFEGWKQLRKFLLNEHNLVGHLEGRGPWDARS